MSVKEEISSAFAEVGLEGVNDEILSRCVGLASTLHTTPKQMAEVWEAYSLTKNLTDLTDHTFQGFRNDLFKQADVVDQVVQSGAVVGRPGLGKRNLPLVTPPPNKRTTPAGKSQSSSGIDSVATRVSISPTKSVVTPSHISTYHDRTDAAKVEVSFSPNDKLMDVSTDESSSSPKAVLTYDFDTNVQKPYRHMFTTLEERAEALDNHLVNMGDLIVERYGIDSNDEEIPLQAVGVPGEEVVRCVGRICSEAHKGKMNDTSVVLEGCRHVSNGCRINVDLSKIKDSKTSFSLFPGQIVAVEGVNHCGRDMMAHSICEGAGHTANKSTVEDLMHYHYDVQNGEALKIMSVCGPYTTSDNLDYAPLADLLLGVKAEKPDVVIMAGPFVDLRHEQINEGDLMMDLEDGTKMNVDYDSFFANKVASMIEGVFDEEMHTQFVLVPSMDDANAEWVYPQAPLTDRVPNGGKSMMLPGVEGLEFGTLGLHHAETAGDTSSKKGRRVHCVSNPCTFKVNEVVIGVGSTDVLFDMNKNATNANLVPGTTITRMAQHLLLQQSYHPLFPTEETSLDLKHMNQWSMPCQPDVLIVPSKLQRFARTVLNHTVVVNPGYLSRGPTGGTYATMSIHPIPRETLEDAGGDNVEMEHGVPDRIQVEIKRI